MDAAAATASKAREATLAAVTVNVGSIAVAVVVADVAGLTVVE